MNQFLDNLRVFFNNALIASRFIVTTLSAVPQSLAQLIFKVANFTISLVEFSLKTIKFFADFLGNIVLHQFFSPIAFFFLAGYAAGKVPINEEILVVFCFACALRLIYLNLGESIAAALNERSEGIRKELSAFLLVKQENLNELYVSEQNFLNTTKNLAILQNYCQTHFVHLDQNQQKALAGLVAQNLHAKLEALQVVKKSLQPTLHAQMSLSFREAVLENFKEMDTSESIAECLKKVKEVKKL